MLQNDHSNSAFLRAHFTLRERCLCFGALFQVLLQGPAFLEGHKRKLLLVALFWSSLTFSVFLSPLKKWWTRSRNECQTNGWLATCFLKQMTMISRCSKSKQAPIISFQNIPKPLRAQRAGRPPPLTLTIPGKCLEWYQSLGLSETRWLAPTTRFTTTRLD